MTPDLDAAATGSLNKPQLFLFDNGFLFCSAGLVSGCTERFSGQLLLATAEQEFEVEINGQRLRQGALVLKPFVPRALNAPGVPFVSLGVSPNHPAYRFFSLLRSPGHQALPRALFYDQLESLNDLRAGRLGPAATQALFEECVGVVTALLPAPKPLDARIARVMELLGSDPLHDLEALARTVCLSYYRLSHLFSQEMGVSLRQYQPWFKVHAACHFLCEGMSLTDTAHAAGFCDSSHMARMWVRAFGASPSFYLNRMAFSIQARLDAARRPAASRLADSGELAGSLP